VTFVDTSDLSDRACSVCGAVVGDALRHRRWHREEDARTDATVDVLRALTSDLERRAKVDAGDRT
jgi:hypothetical protein